MIKTTKTDNIVCKLPENGIFGQCQPPKNNKTVNILIVNVLIYSARKKTDQWAPLYSTKGPPTTSDSAWWISKGVLPSSANPAIKNKTNPRGWIKILGIWDCLSTCTLD